MHILAPHRFSFVWSEKLEDLHNMTQSLKLTQPSVVVVTTGAWHALGWNKVPNTTECVNNMNKTLDILTKYQTLVIL